MAKKRPPAEFQRDLLAALEAACVGTRGPHANDQRTDTDWGPPYGMRMTWTCKVCGRIRGRVGEVYKDRWPTS